MPPPTARYEPQEPDPKPWCSLSLYHKLIERETEAAGTLARCSDQSKSAEPLTAPDITVALARQEVNNTQFKGIMNTKSSHPSW